MLGEKAREVIHRCRLLAACSEEPGFTTRTFLSAPMRDVHAHLTRWMQDGGMTVTIDHAGNLRGVYPASSAIAPRFFIGSHLDTVIQAGAFDGILGVVFAVSLVEILKGEPFPFAIEVVGFSEEEGVRFGVPFIGSRALAGSVDAELLERRDTGGVSVGDAIRSYGLDPSRIGEAQVEADAVGYLEFHIEQGPVLDGLGLPLAIVDRIVGQSRLAVDFAGAANHAGTTPMPARRDALAGASEWIGAVETLARDTPGLVATVGHIEALPGAANVIPGSCLTSLDVRHAEDAARGAAVTTLIDSARAIVARRGLDVQWDTRLDQPSTPMDPALVARLERAVSRSGSSVHRMASGAGHDAVIMAGRMPSAMLFIRSPLGISHHPDETVIEDDVAAALAAGQQFLEDVARSIPWST
jgi:allantoate deiminase